LSGSRLPARDREIHIARVDIQPVADSPRRLGREAEQRIRTGAGTDDGTLDEIDPYWADLVRLLQVLRCKRNNDLDGITALRHRINRLYFPFIDRLAQAP
jgi:hypothetical protein